MPNAKPTVGRIVHYLSHGTPIREDGTQAYKPECRAAVVTSVGGSFQSQIDGSVVDTIGLCVLNPTGMFFHEQIEQDAHGHGGTWHWPERVD